jgi:hypothetical protein
MKNKEDVSKSQVRIFQDPRRRAEWPKKLKELDSGSTKKVP